MKASPLYLQLSVFEGSHARRFLSLHLALSFSEGSLAQRTYYRYSSCALQLDIKVGIVIRFSQFWHVDMCFYSFGVASKSSLWLWHQDLVLALQFLTLLRVVLLCFATRSLQIFL